MGDYLFARYRLETILFEGSVFTLYDVRTVLIHGSVVDSEEKVQIKIYHSNYHQYALSELTNYMNLYEGKLLQEGWLAQLKDFFFFKVDCQ